MWNLQACLRTTLPSSSSIPLENLLGYVSHSKIFPIPMFENAISLTAEHAPIMSFFWSTILFYDSYYNKRSRKRH